LGILISFVIIIILSTLIETNITYSSRINIIHLNWEKELYIIEPMMYAGVLICTYLNSYFIVISLVLLLALIGAIVLALDNF
jgi:NADH:ubiquinone oxidoreductase subunit 6 (subunit J)